MKYRRHEFDWSRSLELDRGDSRWLAGELFLGNVTGITYRRGYNLLSCIVTEVSLDARSQSRLSSHRERKKGKKRPPSGAVNDSLNRECKRERERERRREATAKDIGQFPGAEGLKVYQDERPSRGSIGYIKVGTTRREPRSTCNADERGTIDSWSTIDTAKKHLRCEKRAINNENRGNALPGLFVKQRFINRKRSIYRIEQKVF